jgi:hypothetical protein
MYQLEASYFSDSIGDEDSEAPTYLDMLRHNTDVIVAALSTEKAEKADAETPEKEGSDWIIWIAIAVLFLGAFVWVLRNVKM